MTLAIAARKGVAQGGCYGKRENFLVLIWCDRGLSSVTRFGADQASIANLVETRRCLDSDRFFEGFVPGEFLPWFAQEVHEIEGVSRQRYTLAINNEDVAVDLF